MKDNSAQLVLSFTYRSSFFNQVKNLTAEETLEWVMNSAGDTKTLNMLKDGRTGLSSAGIKRLIKDMANISDTDLTKKMVRLERV